MSEDAAIREANKALESEPRGVVKYLLIPLNLAKALRDVATEWIKGSKI